MNSKTVVALMGVLLITLSVFAPASVPAVRAQNDDQIVYSSGQNGAHQLFIMNADGSSPRQLTSQGDNTEPNWSSDRSQIAYTSDDGGISEVHVISASGSGDRQVTHGGGYTPNWSPDGQRIAFISDRTGGTQLFVTTPDGSNVLQLTNDLSSSATAPAWSPDDRTIAFVYNQGGQSAIWLINSDGSNLRIFTHDQTGEDYGTAWSPDGQHLAYVSTVAGDSDIRIVDANGQNALQVASLTAKYADTVTWSPDGSQLAFAAWGRRGPKAIFVVASDGSGALSQLSQSGDDAGTPSWASIHLSGGGSSSGGSSGGTSGGVVHVNANDFATYPGGYQVTVTAYDVDPTNNTVRIYFQASASSSDLRPPSGTYLQSGSSTYAPTNSNWTSSGATYYSGWFDFDASFFRSGASNHLMYCGCGLYDITLTNLSGYFAAPSGGTNSSDDVSGTWIGTVSRSDGATVPYTLQLTASGTSVSGQSQSQINQGTVYANLSGSFQNGQLSLDEYDNPPQTNVCYWRLTLSMVGGTQLTGTYHDIPNSSTTCNGSGTIQLSRSGGGASAAPTTASWSLIWDKQNVSCGSTPLTYYNFTSDTTETGDGSRLTRTAVGGSSPSYRQSQSGEYDLEAPYNDLSAYVTTEHLHFVNNDTIRGQRSDTFSDLGCSVSVAFTMYRN